MLFDGLFRDDRPGRIPPPSKTGEQAKRNNKEVTNA
jgi:hypothetical protein